MQSIETTQVDQYAQTVLMDRTLTTEQRAESAASAMIAHVYTEFGLPFGSPFPLGQDDEERVYWQEDHLERVADSAMQDLMAKSYEAFEWIEDQYPEEPQIIDGLLKLVKEVKEMDANPATFVGEQPWPFVDLTHEGDTRFYNDDKDEQQ